ncbi:hypothetical protein GCM10007874_17680 [Labrys miyagiensis]|uniref:Uncharacterized protein n=1 Tax=Labrys miyagiensis TaxID=346912 RepID=A0ABQ6CEQ3_9HYPH|nr:hypothetical protein [Labrys miyagiensis]GLS18751.1 hypothetical protein GCM10007874_17680 [Labrys miyagiensis]
MLERVATFIRQRPALKWVLLALFGVACVLLRGSQVYDFIWPRDKAVYPYHSADEANKAQQGAVALILATLDDERNECAKGNSKSCDEALNDERVACSMGDSKSCDLAKNLGKPDH